MTLPSHWSFNFCGCAMIFLKMTEDRLKKEQKRIRIQTNNINRILCWTNGNAIFLLFHFLKRINNHNIQYRTRLKKVQYRTRLKNVNKWRWHLANNHFMNLIPNTQSIQIVIKLSDLKWWLHHFSFIKTHLFLSLILHKPSEKKPMSFDSIKHQHREISKGTFV